MKDPSTAAVEQHFSTAHLMDDLAGRTARGAVVTIGAQVVKLALQIGSTMVLARLLAPGDFGLIAMVAVFTGFVGLFKSLGLSMATVQRAEVGHGQVSALFWLNVSLSLVLAVAVAAAAPAVAWFYSEPALLEITIVIGSTFVFGGLSAQHTALLRRQMRFRELAGVEIAAMALGIAAAIGLALAGAGYWALVALTAVQAAATALLCIVCSGWVPGRPHIDAVTLEMIRFGSSLTATSLLNYLTRNADNLLIGRFLGAAPLGIYSKAYGLVLLPLHQITRPISAAVVPSLSRLQFDPDAYRQAYTGSVRIVAYIAMPLVVLLAVLAEEIVFIVLGPQWMDAALIFRIFSVSVVTQTVSVTTGWVLTSLGRGRRMLTWGAIQAPLALLAFGLGLPWGVVGVATAATVMSLLLTLPSMAFAYHGTPVSVGDVARAVWRPIVVSAVLLVATGAALELVSEQAVWLRVPCVLLTGGLCGAAILGVSSHVRRDLSGIAHLVRG